MRITIGKLRGIIKEVIESAVAESWKLKLKEVEEQLETAKDANMSDQVDALNAGHEAMKAAMESYASEVDLDKLNDMRDQARGFMSRLDRIVQSIPENPKARNDDPVRLYAGLISIQKQRLKKVSAVIENSIFTVNNVQKQKMKELDDLVKAIDEDIGNAKAGLTKSRDRVWKFLRFALGGLNEAYKNLKDNGEPVAAAMKKWPEYEEFFKMIVEEAPTSTRATPEAIKIFRKKLESHPLYRETKSIDGFFDEPE